MHGADLDIATNPLVTDSAISPRLYNALNNGLSTLYSFLADHGAEVNYMIGVPAKYFVLAGKMPSNLQLAGCLAWNYLDALYAVMQVISQLKDKTDFYPSTSFKASANLVSAAQLFLLSYTPWTRDSLAGPAFAFAMFCDFLNASIEYVELSKELTECGWPRNRKMEVAWLKEHMSQTKNTEEYATLETRLQCVEFSLEHNVGNLYKRHEPSYLLSVTDENGVTTEIASGNEVTPPDYFNKVTDWRLDGNSFRGYTAHKELFHKLVIKCISFVGMTLFAIVTLLPTSLHNEFLMAATLLVTIAALDYFNNIISRPIRNCIPESNWMRNFQLFLLLPILLPVMLIGLTIGGRPWARDVLSDVALPQKIKNFLNPPPEELPLTSSSSSRTSNRYSTFHHPPDYTGAAGAPLFSLNSDDFDYSIA